jgi:peptide/nickel transport system permease protein
MELTRGDKLRSFFTVPLTVSLLFLASVVIIAVFADKLATHDPNRLDVTRRLSAPSREHLLGTDKTGRDIYSRLLYGSRITILSAFGVVFISAVIGIPLGISAGYFGGLADKVFMRMFDVILAFPSLLLAFVFVAAFGRGITNAVFALGIVYVPMLARLTRSLVLVEKNKAYVEAARSIGYSNAHIMMTEILPNCVDTLAVQMTLDIGYAVLDLASMSFLGLGVQPPTSDWGAMLEDGWIIITSNPFVALAPGTMIVITVVALNIFGDGVRSYLDPAQKKLPSIHKYRRSVRDPSK